MKRLLHEPLVHFLALGAVLFVAYSVLNRGTAHTPDTIVVTRGRIDAMTAAFTKAQNRPPSNDEIETLIDAYVREEASVREAIALGLDKDDPIMRRRLQEKLDFVSGETEGRAPSDEELAAFLAAHPEDFRGETRYTFEHVFFDRGKRGADAEKDARVALVKLKTSSFSGGEPMKDRRGNLRGGVSPTAGGLGDRFELDAEFSSVTGSDVAMRFGDTFAQALAQLPDGTWSEPIASAYGHHLVLIRHREEGRIPTLGEARDAVRREWERAQRAKARAEYERALVGKYGVKIER